MEFQFPLLETNEFFLKYIQMNGITSRNVDLINIQMEQWSIIEIKPILNSRL